MISRREVMAAGMFGSLAGKGGLEETIEQAVEEVAALRAGFKTIEDQLKELNRAIERSTHGNSMDFGGVASVKNKIQDHAKTSGKFPDYCDIGLGIFHDVYDWHVRNQQQINISRIADQRLAIQFMFTQLVLRWENIETYVGTPYSL